MEFTLSQIGAAAQPSDCVMVAVYEKQQLSPAAQQLDNASGGYLSQMLQQVEIEGKVGQSLMLHHVPHLSTKRVLLLGCGDQAQALSERQYQQVVQKAFSTLRDTNAQSAVSFLNEVQVAKRGIYWKVRFALEAVQQARYQFDAFKSKKSEQRQALNSIVFAVSADDIARAEQAIAHARAIANGVKAAKDVANCPPNVCNPAYLADCAKQLADESALLNTTIIDEAQMAELKMDAYLAVSRGSHNPAFMSVMEYKNHPNPQAKPIVLVGKGLTFDAGGISLKPAAEMDEMKYDMGGAAAVYGVMKAVAELKLPLNIVAILAGCENLPDGNAYRPGDILTTMNGLTVEVLNTDAEGRLVLCDALTYVERFEPEVVIDVATLTGACVVALGQHNSGLVTSDDQLAAELEHAAQQSLDKAWRLPLSEEYQEQLKSNFADLANIGGRWGGASTAAAFLSNFTKKYPWAHLDIAGTAWKSGAEKGATGRPVALLLQYLLNKAK
ncbi:leucyl aminopeptidase [Testudinibacter sp. TR-2022]|uniref:leucyl aminopeptidase n=1 Tax=Testudinibacter sp. TR-2022 TaxID=2585029 RepID=UPI0011183887|nr:leucyl aminopeptidase [Testudinibacter sp. TR-2022]TNH06538.1 leucyl aminopeptidase [Pasteurellaceae bacterium Phil11]TNH23592.1 leucyl aminopeptidase [Testudinibacter sp. TR-2022]TNH27832.1 leucyl aminopeptidase [Testudinibacter sp. TR-2022]